ncbi:MAG: VWA domain-containing protein [Acidobacteria bacterium]|nr:VWA domain-containing protein [Acidobacteriota bacterium]
MSLLAPLFLAGALAVGLPLWLHLLQRENPIRLPFSSLMFFEKRKTSTLLERKWRYLLLMALRLALIALAALAFAKPIWERPPTTIVSDIPSLQLITLDTSLSMGHDGRWQRALAAADTVIDGLGEADRAQILATGPSVRVITQPTRDKAELKAAAASLEPGSSSNSFGDVIEAARSLSPDGDTPVELHLISDFQSSAMPGRFSDLVLPTMAQLEVHNVSEPDDANWAIESVKGTLRLHESEKPRLEATVASYSTQPARKTVTLEINGQAVDSISQEVAAMGRTSFLFEGFEAPKGYSRARLALSPADDLPADDVRLVALDNSPPEPILFVTADRRRRDALFYQEALRSSTQSVLQVEVSSPGDAERRNPSEFALVVLSDVGQLSTAFEQKLRSYVEGGGALLVAVGPETARRGSIPALGMRVTAGRLPQGGEFQLAGRVDETHEALSRVESLRGVEFFQTARLQVEDGDEVLATLADGAPLLVERRLGEGRALVFASTLDNVWNDLPVRPVFVPFAAESARYLAGAAERTATLTVDDALELGRRREASRMVQVYDPAGNRALSLSEAMQRDDLTLDQAGFWELRGEGGVEIVAVNPDPRESNMRPIDDETLRLWRSTGRSGGVAAEGGAATPIKPPPVEIWKWLLFLLVAIVLIESVVGNRRLDVRREV